MAWAGSSAHEKIAGKLRIDNPHDQRDCLCLFTGLQVGNSTKIGQVDSLLDKLLNEHGIGFRNDQLIGYAQLICQILEQILMCRDLIRMLIE